MSFATVPSRREFLQTAIGSAVAPLLLTNGASGAGAVSPSERIALGVIGLGSRGFNLIQDLLQQPDAQIVAICDVDELHYRDRQWGQGRAYGRTPARQLIERAYGQSKSGRDFRGLRVYDDFRELCRRDDLDAVVVATPDHWHALCALTALRAGLDIYCEKPVTHTFREGQVLYREVAEREAVFQTGSQQRSDPLFRRAVELVLNGHLGDLQRVEVGLPPGYDSPQGETTVKEPPEHLDYDMWCGPAPRLPYMRARHHRWWRGHRAFGGGVLMDWIGHHNDIAHWALGMDRLGPTRVEAVDWTFPDTDVYDTPHEYTIQCAYPGGITTRISCRNPMGARFVGDAGWVSVRRGRLEASDPRWTESSFHPGSIAAAESPGHMRNFLDCVKSRKECVAPAEVAHRSITPGHLGYVSHALGRPLSWDAERERIVDDAGATRLLEDLQYRAPWSFRGARAPA